MEFLKHFFMRIIVLLCWGVLYALTFILLVWGLLGIDPFTAIEMMKKNVPQRREKIEALYEKVSNKELPAVPEKKEEPRAEIAVSLEEVSEQIPPVPSELVPPAVNPQAQENNPTEDVLKLPESTPVTTPEPMPEPVPEQEPVLPETMVAEPVIPEIIEAETVVPPLSVVNVLTEDMVFDEEPTDLIPTENAPVMDMHEEVIDIQNPAENGDEEKEDDFVLPSQDLHLQE